MEENSSLFGLSIDSASKEHLTEAARWARFLSIVGFISLGLLVVLGIATSATLSRMSDAYGAPRGMGTAVGTTSAVLYIIMAVIYFFPLLYLFRFANAMQAALRANDQERLTVSFQNLKSCLRYVGILTVIALVFMLIAIVMVMAGMAVSS